MHTPKFQGSRRQLIGLAATTFAGTMTAQDSAGLRKMLEPPTGKVPVVIDTDTFNEIDDQYAVAYGILSPNRMDVEAVYAAPFVNDRSKSAAEGMEKSYEEILRILKFLGRSADRFAFRGSERFFAGAGKPTDSPAARDLIKRAMQPRSTPLYAHAALCFDAGLPGQCGIGDSPGAEDQGADCGGLAGRHHASVALGARVQP